MSKITMTTDPEAGTATFTVKGETKTVVLSDYPSGKAVKDIIMSWARPFGGTESEGF